MAFAANDNQQLTLTDSTLNLTQREKRVLEKSWAKTFAEKVFPAIDESIFSVLYSDKASRPNTPVNVIVGALILKEALGDTDDELVESLMFDVRYQYALHTTSFEEQPLNDRTLSRFRARVLAYETEHDVDLIHECVLKMAKEIAEFMNIDTDRLYTTGQSMGCMTSLYLNSKYPDLFAASLFVSGQWDITVLKGLENEKFFYITAGGDGKASGGQDEVKAMFDADGVGYSYGTWSAQNSVEEQSQAAEELIAQGHDANMIRFETGSVLNGGSGMEHAASFNYGYKIPAVRDWLFAQTK